MPLHIFTHPSCLQHDPGPGHPESPRRLETVLARLRQRAPSDDVVWHEADPADETQLTRVHPRSYLERLEAVAARGGGRLDGDTVMSAYSFAAARHAAGAAVAVAREALRGAPAFAAVRPPGHHATATVAMGFCLINSVVVAARAALEDGAERVLIVDWDVHHGNGTQDLVETEARIRYVSLHQSPLYPGTGRAEDRGVGNIFNYPRPPGLPRAEYQGALDDGVACATDGWHPDLMLISAGFDALAGDPLAGFTLEPEDFATWTTCWRGMGVPIGSVLEGGYVPERVAEATARHLEALSAGR